MSTLHGLPDASVGFSMNEFTFHHHRGWFDLVNLRSFNFEKILVRHNEIGELATFYRASLVFRPERIAMLSSLSP